MDLLPGIRIGHWHDPIGVTGCTVLLPVRGAMGASVSVRGGAPGTRETDLLAPEATVQEIHALLLTGGSAFGLDAATGVMAYLRAQGIGYATPVARVPIVPATVIFDLDSGSPEVWPSAAAGRAACEAATVDEAREGTVGAGYGASVGRALGASARAKGGLGLASDVLPDGARVGALAVVNAVGDVLDERGEILAGARREDGRFAGSAALLQGGAGSAQPMTNTTLVAVATSARLDKTALRRLASHAHDGLARAISPVHTVYDGDTVFALSTGDRASSPDAIGILAVELVAAAIRHAVRAATSIAGVPALRDLQMPLSS